MRASVSPSPHPLRRAFLSATVGAVLLAGLPSPAGASHEPYHLEPIGIGSFCAAVPEGSSYFPDIATSIFRSDVECLFVPRITRGIEDLTLYAPERLVPRDQMASFVARMISVAEELEQPERDLQDVPVCAADVFADIEGNDHACAIGSLGLVDVVFGGVGGRPVNQYSPSIPVTRAQMATFVERAIEHLLQEDVGTEIDHFFDDDGDTHEPAIDYVGEHGIAVGDGHGTFDPDKPVTRGQMAAFLARTLAVLVEQSYISPLAPTG